MNVKLLENRVLVDRDTAAKISPGGIALPGKEPDPLRGTVVAVGPGRMTNEGKRLPMTVQVDDIVLFETGTKVTIDDKEYVVMSEKDIMLIIGPKDSD